MKARKILATLAGFLILPASDVKAVKAVLWSSRRLLFLRGFLAISFGVLISPQPGDNPYDSLLLLFFYSLVDGILGLATAIAGHRELEHWGVLFLDGLRGVGIGIAILSPICATDLEILAYIALVTISMGALEIVGALRLPERLPLFVLGLTSVMFGIVLVRMAVTGVHYMGWLIALYIIILGTMLVILASRARRIYS